MVSEELVRLLQQKHDYIEQIEMRKIAIEQLLRLQMETKWRYLVVILLRVECLTFHKTTIIDGVALLERFLADSVEYLQFHFSKLSCYHLHLIGEL